MHKGLKNRHRLKFYVLVVLLDYITTAMPKVGRKSSMLSQQMAVA